MHYWKMRILFKFNLKICHFAGQKRQYNVFLQGKLLDPGSVDHPLLPNKKGHRKAFDQLTVYRSHFRRAKPLLSPLRNFVEVTSLIAVLDGLSIITIFCCIISEPSAIFHGCSPAEMFYREGSSISLQMLIFVHIRTKGPNSCEWSWP